MTANNVVVQFVRSRTLDNVGRQWLDLNSGGEAIVAVDGQTYRGTWKRDAGRTIFLDASGNEFKFNSGLTWVEVAPVGTVVNAK